MTLLAITRRITDGHFWMVQTDEMWNAFLYTIAVGAKMHAIDVHAAVMMTDHYHLVITDRLGQRSDFLKFVNRQLSILIQEIAGVDVSAVWEPNKKPDTRSLEDLSSVLHSLAYAHANPVKAGMVKATAEMRNGVASLALGSAYHATKPRGFFHDKEKFPEEATLELVAPSMWLPAPGSIDFEREEAAFLDSVKSLCETMEEKAREHIRSLGRTFIGWRRVVTMSRKVKAKPLPKGARTFTFKAFCAKLRAKKKDEMKRWRAAYRTALEAFNAGDRDVLFPPGTYWMVKFHGCRC